MVTSSSISKNLCSPAKDNDIAVLNVIVQLTMRSDLIVMVSYRNNVSA